MFVIDKEYDLCPVGKPQFDMKYRVVDDDGNDVPDGEIGEFVFKKPYVRIPKICTSGLLLQLLMQILMVILLSS